MTPLTKMQSFPFNYRSHVVFASFVLARRSLLRSFGIEIGFTGSILSFRPTHQLISLKVPPQSAACSPFRHRRSIHQVGRSVERDLVVYGIGRVEEPEVQTRVYIIISGLSGLSNLVQPMSFVVDLDNV